MLVILFFCYYNLVELCQIRRLIVIIPTVTYGTVAHT